MHKFFELAQIGEQNLEEAGLPDFLKKGKDAVAGGAKAAGGFAKKHMVDEPRHGFKAIKRGASDGILNKKTTKEKVFGGLRAAKEHAGQFKGPGAVAAAGAAGFGAKKAFGKKVNESALDARLANVVEGWAGDLLGKAKGLGGKAVEGARTFGKGIAGDASAVKGALSAGAGISGKAKGAFGALRPGTRTALKGGTLGLGAFGLGRASKRKSNG